MESRDEQLLIPSNSPEIEYVLIGFTSMDIICILCFIGVGGLLGMVIYSHYPNTVIPVVMMLVFGAIGVMIFQRDRYTENLIDKAKIYIKYLKAQKEYRYEKVHLGDVYEGSK